MARRDGKVQIGHHWPEALHAGVVALVGARRVAAFDRAAVAKAVASADPEVIAAANAATGGAPRKTADTAAEVAVDAPVGDGRQRCPTHNRLPVAGGRCPQCTWKPAAAAAT